MEELQRTMAPEAVTPPDTTSLLDNNVQVKKKVIGFGLVLGALTTLLLVFLYFKQSSPDTISTQGPNKFQNRILAKSPQLTKQNTQYYWANPDGSILAPLDFKIPLDNERKLITSASLSPDHSRMLVIVGDKLEGNFQYDYYVTSPQGEVITKLDPVTVRSLIGSFKYVDFLSWITGDSLYFVAKNERVLSGDAQETRVILGKYNVNTQEARVLVDRQSRGIGAPYLSKNGQWLAYINDYGLLSSQRILKNLATQEERAFNNNGYLFTGGEYWVAFPKAGENFKANLNETRSLIISSITASQAPVGTVNLTDPRRYFVHGYQSLSWSDDYSLFAVIADYDRSGYAIAYQEPQLFVYDQQGNQKCMWGLADGDLSNNSVNPELYSEKVFSPDNRYLLLASKPNADYFRTSYWRSFDLSNCLIHKPKTKVEEELIPLMWL